MTSSRVLLRSSLKCKQPALRICAIDPGWDGKFKTAGVKAVETESSRGPAKPASSRSPFPTILGLPGARAGDAGFATNAVLMGAVLPNLGKPTPLHLRYAEELRKSFPEKVQSAAHEPLDATEQGLAEEEALKKGMEEKSREFPENGSELYAKA